VPYDRADKGLRFHGVPPKITGKTRAVLLTGVC
jgi:hypothetical protein